MKTSMIATLLVAMIAAGPVLGMAAADSESRTPYAVPVDTTLAFLVEGSNPSLDQSVGNAGIVDTVDLGLMTLVFVHCFESPLGLCTGDIVT